MIAIGVIVNVPIFARLLRGSMLAQRAARLRARRRRASACARRKIVLSHVLPNSLGPVIVQATLTLATAIIEAAALSFLGLGNPDPAVPEWGAMLSDAQNLLRVAPARWRSTRRIAIISPRSASRCSARRMREALDPKLPEVTVR